MVSHIISFIVYDLATSLAEWWDKSLTAHRFSGHGRYMFCVSSHLFSFWFKVLQRHPRPRCSSWVSCFLISVLFNLKLLSYFFKLQMPTAFWAHLVQGAGIFQIPLKTWLRRAEKDRSKKQPSEQPSPTPPIFFCGGFTYSQLPKKKSTLTDYSTEAFHRLKSLSTKPYR